MRPDRASSATRPFADASTRSLTTVDFIISSACSVDGRLPVCGGVRRLLWKKLCISASIAIASPPRPMSCGVASCFTRTICSPPSENCIGTPVTVETASITSGPVSTRAKWRG